MNYSYNDNEILYLINEDPEQYQSILFDKYKPVIYNIVIFYYNEYKDIGLTFDDLMQEGYIGFYNAINSFNGKYSLFYTYSIICIKRNIISYIRSFTKKNNVINYALDDSHLNDLRHYDEDVFDSLDYEYDYVNYKNSLDFNENLLFELLLNGFTYDEISILLDIPKKMIYRISFKLKKCIKEQSNL